VSEESLHDQLRFLLDRTSISDVVCKFAVSIDRRRWDDFASCFAEEVELNTIRTGRWVRMERSQLMESLQRAFESYTATQHVSANHQVAIDGDEAIVLSTLNATHYLEGAQGGEFQQQVGYYEYHLVNDGGWRITRVQQFAHWQRGNQAIFDATLRQP
jgi:hypothetical protein